MFMKIKLAVYRAEGSRESKQGFQLEKYGSNSHISLSTEVMVGEVIKSKKRRKNGIQRFRVCFVLVCFSFILFFPN